MEANKKNVYAAALKYEAMDYYGIEKICHAIDPNGYESESTAWCWIEMNEDNDRALKAMLRKIGYEIKR